MFSAPYMANRVQDFLHKNTFCMKKNVINIANRFVLLDFLAMIHESLYFLGCKYILIFRHMFNIIGLLDKDIKREELWRKMKS